MEWKLAGFMLIKTKEDGTYSWSFNKAISMKSLMEKELLIRTPT
jgi:hypothetical protein